MRGRGADERARRVDRAVQHLHGDLAGVEAAELDMGSHRLAGRPRAPRTVSTSRSSTFTSGHAPMIVLLPVRPTPCRAPSCRQASLPALAAAGSYSADVYSRTIRAAVTNGPSEPSCASSCRSTRPARRRRRGRRTAGRSRVRAGRTGWSPRADRGGRCRGRRRRTRSPSRSWPSKHSSHQPSRMLQFKAPLSAAFIPLVPHASSGRRGLLSHTSQPWYMVRATAMS